MCFVLSGSLILLFRPWQRAFHILFFFLLGRGIFNWWVGTALGFAAVLRLSLLFFSHLDFYGQCAFFFGSCHTVWSCFYPPQFTFMHRTPSMSHSCQVVWCLLFFILLVAVFPALILDCLFCVISCCRVSSYTGKSVFCRGNLEFVHSILILRNVETKSWVLHTIMVYESFCPVSEGLWSSYGEREVLLYHFDLDETYCEMRCGIPGRIFGLKVFLLSSTGLAYWGTFLYWIFSFLLCYL